MGKHFKVGSHALGSFQDNQLTGCDGAIQKNKALLPLHYVDGDALAQVVGYRPDVGTVNSHCTATSGTTG